MPAVYSALDVFALPSWREGFSRSAMEAAACGVAMVLSDVRGCREIGDDGVHLRLAPPGDADAWSAVLGELIADPAQRARLGAAARQRAAVSFDQRRVAAQSVAAYRDTAARRARWR
jgi:glycosyltransferase involved in cell wall biosynthesis